VTNKAGYFAKSDDNVRTQVGKCTRFSATPFVTQM